MGRQDIMGRQDHDAKTDRALREPDVRSDRIWSLGAACHPDGGGNGGSNLPSPGAWGPERLGLLALAALASGQ